MISYVNLFVKRIKSLTPCCFFNPFLTSNLEGAIDILAAYVTPEEKVSEI